jgi:hypothetical protein
MIDNKKMLMDLFSPNSINKILRVGSEVTTKELEVYERKLAADDKSYRMRQILGVWKEQQNQDRTMRRLYGNILLFFMGGEILLSIILIFLIGSKCMNYDEWVINIFFVGVFTQVSSFIIVIVKYLFPDIKEEFIKVIERL